MFNGQVFKIFSARETKRNFIEILPCALYSQAAETTGAWIITGGTNTGVMRHVGEAVRGHTVMSRGAQLKDNAQQVHLIGIATWGIVDHRKILVANQVNS